MTNKWVIMVFGIRLSIPTCKQKDVHIIIAIAMAVTTCQWVLFFTRKPINMLSLMWLPSTHLRDLSTNDSICINGTDCTKCENTKFRCELSIEHSWHLYKRIESSVLQRVHYFQLERIYMYYNFQKVYSTDLQYKWNSTLFTMVFRQFAVIVSMWTKQKLWMTFYGNISVVRVLMI